MHINPYLSFNDNCEEAFHFYRSVFGGEFGRVMRFSDVPGTPYGNEPKIMHMELPIGNGTTLMGSDTPDDYKTAEKTASGFHISLHVDSEEQGDKLYKGLSTGGTVIVPMDHAFWGNYFGMLVDPYGIQWMITYSKPQ